MKRKRRIKQKIKMDDKMKSFLIEIKTENEKKNENIGEIKRTKN